MTGRSIVLTGPSGVGKGTLLKALLARRPELYLSVSATTRSPREGEIDGVHYYFYSRDRFEAEIAAGALLEWAEFAGNYYGTPIAPVQAQLDLGRSVILEIELAGARQVAQIFPTALRIFILPPDLQTLEMRIRDRGTDSPEAILRRLEQAKVEIAARDEFDHQIVNDDFQTALEELDSLVTSA
ncbi:guanylate kinase [Chamaesiphon minutus]|uniref:Guanylate kinase n=1 Tax=Chamaesiphon minutus (strain ATCC 27169 / PCC 6605) TaxID=1173020 RepID=K9UMC5_CHAP6|nr:guanylate kinase [Chamaesiphon minutus]AFY95980.1 guanylate kinase [Chamaesiphon minutus PCC 6605]